MTSLTSHTTFHVELDIIYSDSERSKLRLVAISPFVLFLVLSPAYITYVAGRIYIIISSDFPHDLGEEIKRVSLFHIHGVDFQGGIS
ncbi:hypothetical protein YC2023_037685 [Brassica napus]